jgi:hypothetical protein
MFECPLTQVTCGIWFHGRSGIAFVEGDSRVPRRDAADGAEMGKRARLAGAAPSRWAWWGPGLHLAGHDCRNAYTARPIFQITRARLPCWISVRAGPCASTGIPDILALPPQLPTPLANCQTSIQPRRCQVNLGLGSTHPPCFCLEINFTSKTAQVPYLPASRFVGGAGDMQPKNLCEL